MRDQARTLLGNRQLVFSLLQQQGGREEWDLFRRFVDLAVESGATHIHVGNLPFQYGNWVLPDNTDPYAAWCVHCPSILRTCPPEELQPWVDAGEANRVQSFIGRQLEIMRPYGLKATASSVEPMWLPEGVYRAHPRWRGAQCELGRIALKPYFAPSIDEPEVLDLYRRAIRQYLTLFPEIDFFEFMSNDSGAGVAWTPCIYPGMNGPAAWRTRDGGERLADFLKCLQQGATEAGVEARFNFFSSGFPAELKASARAKLPKGCFISWANNHSEKLSVGSANLAGGMWDARWPAVGLGDPAAFVAGLQGIYHNPDNDGGRTSIGVYETDLDWARTLIGGVVAQPGTGLAHRTGLLLDIAAAFAGDSAKAEAIVGAWQQVEQATHTIRQIRQKGFGNVLSFCGVSMRWLLRPLVPRPAALTPAETAHYRDFIFAAGDQKDDPDFGMVLGKSVFNGESVTWMARWCLQEAIGTLQCVRSRLRSIAADLPEGEGRDRVALLAARTGALACLATSARNCIMYKYALDTAAQPQYGPNQVDYDDNIIYDQRALSMRKIAREELDTVTELVELIESTDEVVLDHARQSGEESVFMLPVDLVGALRRKQEIMLDHWQDYELFYPATKVHDFEPDPIGNLIRPAAE